jgi:FMN-dependent NADH-azoreductase
VVGLEDLLEDRLAEVPLVDLAEDLVEAAQQEVALVEALLEDLEAAQDLEVLQEVELVEAPLADLVEALVEALRLLHQDKTRAVQAEARPGEAQVEDLWEALER